MSTKGDQPWLNPLMGQLLLALNQGWHICRILTSFSLGGSYPRLLGRGKLWTTASFPYLGDGRTQLQPVRHWYFSRTSDVAIGDYGRAEGRSR